MSGAGDVLMNETYPCPHRAYYYKRENRQDNEVEGQELNKSKWIDSEDIVYIERSGKAIFEQNSEGQLGVAYVTSWEGSF